MAYLRLVQSRVPDEPSVALFDEELGFIFATLRRFGARRSELEDLAQDVFLVLHKNWHKLDHTVSVRPYLTGVAFRLTCAHQRRMLRQIPSRDLEGADDCPSPEDLVLQSEETTLLLAALDHVPMSRRAVVVMHDLQNIPMEEVARLLSRSLFGTYARLRKGRRELAVAVRRLGRAGRSASQL